MKTNTEVQHTPTPWISEPIRYDAYSEEKIMPSPKPKGRGNNTMENVDNKTFNLKYENAIRDTIPFKEGRTFNQYSKIFLNELCRRSLPVFKALYNKGGNCLHCGEAGRCTGYHIK